jgi:hypothetical protein
VPAEFQVLDDDVKGWAGGFTTDQVDRYSLDSQRITILSGDVLMAIDGMDPTMVVHIAATNGRDKRVCSIITATIDIYNPFVSEILREPSIAAGLHRLFRGMWRNPLFTSLHKPLQR